MNRWKIPDWLEREVIARDQRCIYCGVKFSSTNKTRKYKPTWEHIVNNEEIINRENIARRCCSCNASKGKRDLSVWLESNYCERRGITKNTVAEVVKKALDCPPQIGSPGA